MTGNEIQPDTKPETTDSGERKQTPKRGGCLVGCLILLPILYALSWPVHSIVCYKLYVAGFKDLHDVLLQMGTVVYQPLQFLCDRFDSVRSFYNWYFSLFWRWMPQP